MNRSSTYLNSLRCGLSRLAMIKNNASGTVEPTTPVYRRIPPKNAGANSGGSLASARERIRKKYQKKAVSSDFCTYKSF